MITIRISVTFEVRAQVKQRLRKILALSKLQGDEQPPDTAVSAHERMNRLELVVNQRELDEKRHFILTFTDISLKVMKRMLHLHDGRRHKPGGGRRDTTMTNHVGSGAKLSWALILTSYPFHQPTMHLKNQSEASRHGLQERESKL